MKAYKNIQELCEEQGYENFFQFGRSLYKYTDCGPWCRLILDDESDIYYESEKANDSNLGNVIALEIGSIVEGSDVEIGPVRLTFPFTNEELWDTVNEINEEAKFYWKRDNEDDYLVEVANKEYYVIDSWGLVFPDDMPEGFQRFIEEHYDDMASLNWNETFENAGYRITKIDKSDFVY
jgi:hypothetical protein